MKAGHQSPPHLILVNLLHSEPILSEFINIKKDDNTPHLTIGHNQQNCFVYYWEWGGQNIVRGGGQNIVTIYRPRGQNIARYIDPGVNI